MRLSACACIAAAATVAALRPAPALLRKRIDQRARAVTAQQDQYGYAQQDQYGYAQQQQGYGQESFLPAGWITGVDPSSGQTYYYHEQTGQSQWEPPQQPSQNEAVVVYISERLQEPQTRIVRAVVDALGAETAYGLLDATERIQAQGGMVVPDTGRPRTSGGIFYRLLKEATNLPREAQDAALQCIKTEGKRVKSWEKGVAPGGW
jgi:hypothetical protein